MIKRLMFVAVAAAAFATAAPALAQQSQNDSPWNGWYVGLNAGGNWGHGSQHLSAAPGNGAVVIPPADVAGIASVIDKSNSAGFTGGIEGGYNYAYKSSGLVLGFETDFDAFNLDQNVTKTFQSAVTQPIFPPPPTPMITVTQSQKTDWLWTLRPKIGWETGRWLLYATGGLAVGDVKQAVSYADNRVPANAAAFSNSSTKVGWVAGVGAGYALSSNWAIKAEWLYTDLGTVSSAAATPNGYAVIGASGKIQSNIVRVGVDYRF